MSFSEKTIRTLEFDKICAMLEEHADGQVITTFLPLAGDVVILSTFLRGTFRNLIGDFGHVAVVAREFDAVERDHHRCCRFVQFFDFSAVRKRDSVTSAF